MFPWLTVFTSGTHKTSAAKKTWTEDDVKAIVENTQKQGAERIPFTFDHPTDNLPVLGFFNREDIRLAQHDGKPAIQVRPAAFAGGEDGFRSLAQSTHNKPSILVGIVDKIIKHIGCVEKPAVVDIPSFDSYGFSAAFSKVGCEEVEASFAFDWRTSFEYDVQQRFTVLGEYLQSQRERIIEKDGIEAADKMLPKTLHEIFYADLSQLSQTLSWVIADEVQTQLEKRSAEQQTNKLNSSQFSQEEAMEMKELEAKFSALEQRTAALETENKTLRDENAALHDRTQLAEFRAFAEKLCHSERKITPGEIDEVVENLQLRAASDARASFSEGAKTSVQLYKEKLSARTAMTALFSEQATSGRSSEADASFADDDKFLEDYNKKGVA
ncbi:MAG: hypothetical protein JNL32_06795 [Candidatus Kapabacteria bacterium]|nr:hypothetical protein [Candidatus Kapabacteria bacterium]